MIQNVLRVRKFRSPIYHSVWLLIMSLTAETNHLSAQTIGSTFNVSSASNEMILMQSIGQPFAVFQKMEETGKGSKSVYLNQGQILPSEYFSNKIEAIQLRVFPNPVVDILKVQLEKEGLINAITITDINGRLMVSVKSGLPAVMNEINVSTLAAGIYIVDVTDVNGQSGFVKITKTGQSIE